MTDTVKNIDRDKDSRFSWQRVKALAAYYTPQWRRQIIVYLIASVILSLLLMLRVSDELYGAIYSVVWVVLSLLYALAPLVMAKFGDARKVERMLPVTTAELMTVYLFYFIAVLAAVLFILPSVTELIYFHLNSDRSGYISELYHIRVNRGPMVECVNILGGIATTVSCLYWVFRSRSNRILAGVIAVLAVNLAMGIIGAIWGMSKAFMMGFNDAMNGVSRMPDEEVLAREVVSVLNDGSGFMGIVAILVAIYIIYTIWCTAKVLSNRRL